MAKIPHWSLIPLHTRSPTSPAHLCRRHVLFYRMESSYVARLAVAGRTNESLLAA